MPKGLPIAEYFLLRRETSERPMYPDLFGDITVPLLPAKAADYRVTCYGSVQLAPVGFAWNRGLHVEVRSYLHGAKDEPDRDFEWFTVLIPREKVTNAMLSWAIRRRAELDEYEAQWRHEMAKEAAGRLLK